MFDPMRTFRIGPQTKTPPKDNREHTSWTDLLDKEIGDPKNQYTMQYVIEDILLDKRNRRPTKPIHHAIRNRRHDGQG